MASSYNAHALLNMVLDTMSPRLAGRYSLDFLLPCSRCSCVCAQRWTSLFEELCVVILVICPWVDSSEKKNKTQITIDIYIHTHGHCEASISWQYTYTHTHRFTSHNGHNTTHVTVHSVGTATAY